jgi:hypothetical protein
MMTMDSMLPSLPLQVEIRAGGYAVTRLPRSLKRRLYYTTNRQGRNTDTLAIIRIGPRFWAIITGMACFPAHGRPDLELQLH